MNKDEKRIEEKLKRIEEKLDKFYPFIPTKHQDIQCRLDVNFSLVPRAPQTTSEAMYYQAIETSLKAEIYSDVQRIENRINKFLKYHTKKI
jgi:hypothetical protein